MLTAPPEQVSRAALYGGTTTLLDFAPCPPDQPLQQSIEGAARMGGRLLLRLRLSSDAARQAVAGVLGPLPEAIQAAMPRSRCSPPTSGPTTGRMVQFGDIWEVLKILGGGGRHRGDPRRGQRHRHAHVREADPRGPGRL